MPAFAEQRERASFYFEKAENLFVFAFEFGFQCIPQRTEMHTEENAPAAIPTIRGAANSRIDGTPRMNSAAIVMNVVREV